ncbi:MAG: C40 family peptidase [Xanthomonadales bacterium]|nr:C40 family peptidase [Xanthomonadales bacterium]
MSEKDSAAQAAVWSRRGFVLGAVALLAACSSQPRAPVPLPERPPSRPRPRPRPRPRIALPAPDPLRSREVVFHALQLVGIPYRYGGSNPEGGFDCSGLVLYVHQASGGPRLPRTVREQMALQLPVVPEGQRVAGDLVFFGQGGRPNHIGIYVGEGRFVHAPSTGGTVRLDRLDSRYWRTRYMGTRRVPG